MAAQKKTRPTLEQHKAKASSPFGAELMDKLNGFASKRSFHLFALLVFFFISLVYCSPVLQGKKLNTGDATAGDAFNREFNTYQKAGEKDFIGWTNTMFSGMPRAGSAIEKYNYPYKIVHLGLSLFGGISFEQLIWLMAGFYVLLLALSINRWLALIGAICFALSTFNITSIEAGHALKMFAIACVSPVLAGIIWVGKKSYLKGFLVFTLALAFLLTINHTQITYYTIIACLVLVIFVFGKMLIEKDFGHFVKSGAILLVGALLCGGANLHLLNFYNMSKETMRGGNSELVSNEGKEKSKGEKTGLEKDYALSWSYGKLESLSFLIPNIMGGATSEYLVSNRESETYTALASSGDPNANELAQASTPYWGDQPFVGGPIYFGAILIFLFVLGLLLASNVEKIWLIIVGTIFLFISWGRNISWFTDLLFDYAPLYNKFRTPSMGQSVLQIAIYAIAFLGLNKLFEKQIDKKAVEKKFYIAIGIVGGLTLLVLIIPKLFGGFEAPNDGKLPDWLRNALVSDRIGLAKSDAFRSLLFIAVAAGLIWAYLKDKLSIALVMPIVLFLSVVDLWTVDTRYFNKDDFKKKAELGTNVQPSPADQQILTDQDPHYRVFNVLGGNPFNDAQTSFFHKSVGGYSAVKLLKYQELIDNHLTKGNMAVLSMLNTKYFIVQGQDGGPAVQQNQGACGNAWFVDSLVVVKTANQEMEGMEVNKGFNPLKSALIRGQNIASTKTFEKDSSAQIKLLSYKPHQLAYECNNPKAGFAVFSEVFYKQADGDGWVAKIDGKEQPILEVNYLLRGLEIPAGKHKIEMAMVQPAAEKRGLISVISLFILTAFWVIGSYFISKGKFE
ncbi:MAG: hypothetical protein IPN09_00590 [Bacteroidetes bacterium]|nr:hypothetical protein [Bacteroidota bacterium]